ncbi:MAG: hypothetical protein ABEJ57_09340 [Halobacteriaceae archaeon]
MSREIRITVADDEVFERMRRRKEALDLSWEEALRRGLTDGTTAHESGGTPSPFDEDFKEQLRDRIRAGIAEDTHHPTHEPTTSIDATTVRNLVTDHLEQALTGIVPPEPTDHGPGLDAELDALEDAEDAILTFPTIEDDRAVVPLRVNLTTGGDGLEVDVVAVRRGKDTEDRNVFAAAHREQLTKAMATGATATLSFRDGAETYDVIPSLSWGRTPDGDPTVVDVTIEDVRLED